MSRGTLKGVIITDIHLGCNAIPVLNQIKQIEIWVEDNYDVILDAGHFFIDGDLFDKELPLLVKANVEALNRLYTLFSKLLDSGVVIYLLDGTNSHDLGQGKLFKPLLESHNTRGHYIDEITLLDIEGYSVLFVPDNMGTSEEVLAKINTLLATTDKSSIDMLHIHGSFEYNLPPFLNKHVHKEAPYLLLCKGPIFNGHIHVPGKKDRITTVGSFGTYNHGEEMRKGGMVFELKDNLKFTTKYLYNKHLIKFKQIYLNRKPYKGMSTRSIIKHVNALIDKYHDDAKIHIKIHAPVTHELLSASSMLALETDKAHIRVNRLSTKEPEVEAKLNEFAFNHDLTTNQGILNAFEQWYELVKENTAISTLPTLVKYLAK